MCLAAQTETAHLCGLQSGFFRNCSISGLSSHQNVSQWRAQGDAHSAARSAKEVDRTIGECVLVWEERSFHRDGGGIREAPIIFHIQLC